MRATHRYVRPSGIAETWRVTRLGVSNARCTTHSGQVPPRWEKWNAVADCRLEMLPARSVRTNANGTARAPGRCRVPRRWQVDSNPVPNWAATTSMS